VNKRLTVPDILSKKGKDKIVMLTCYTAQMAKILDNHVDILLVGDSLGMTIYGHKNTLSVSSRMMIDHGLCVVSHSNKALVVIDMPFGTFEADKVKAFETAAELISKTKATAIKIEGGVEIADTVNFIVERGIPVMGHIGLMPQKINLVGKFLSVGKNKKEENKVLADAKAISDAGAFSVVIEAMNAELGKKVTNLINIPCIGIGAGKYCDGQVLVVDDLLGFYDELSPKFVKRYADMKNIINTSVKNYSNEVRNSKFPGNKYSY
jgi:3-methyl-2-oxobutanoate hydroxymethyltransferase